ncbi:hypothetical protein Poli38472_008779 [Pythium oligandrum]|uniref:Kinesin n=1 Tax=Pythium oligandrum TaxID=41045 RepID=A0A8K1FBH3_PYTOL|nr:hypothetical protein Poli38472_008779 [Pythium oligandrum]|eukprot:TMW56131.1 hypothetical protein Poli38472_008779 [Pythium oligandrum]
MLSRRVALPKCISPSNSKTSTPPANAPSSTVSTANQTASKEGSRASSNPGESDDRPRKSEEHVTAVAAREDAGQVSKDCAIKVVIRVRPLSEKELLARSPVVVNVSKSSVQVVNPALFTDPTFLEAISTPAQKVTAGNVPMALSAQAVTAATSAGECRTFHFDRCFGVDNAVANESEPFANAYDIDYQTQRPNQELVFEEIGKDIIPSAFQGFNCTVLAYGQTGSGKTHTMVGEKTIKGKGVIPRVCEALFHGIDARREHEEQRTQDDTDGSGSAKKTVYTVQISYCEIYKEKVHDLLDGVPVSAPSPTSSFTSSSSFPPSPTGSVTGSSSESSASRGRILKVREHPITGPFVEGLSTRLVGSYDEIAEELIAGDKLRTVAATLVNSVSSRSHAVFTMTLTQTTVDPATQLSSVKLSKICMIDLAGSERANVSGTSGDRLKEGAMINKSLTTLGRVISALSKNSPDRVPYRDSTLTWLLKESLGGNAKTTMIAMVSPAAENYDETMSTLRYAESAKKVMNRAVVNEDPNARLIRQLRDEITQLKAQLTKRESEAFYLVENLKDKPELPPSVQDRDEFYQAMQSEVETYHTELEKLKKRQAEEEELRRKSAKIVRLHPEYPSIINANILEEQHGANEVAIFCLGDGISVVGTEEPPQTLDDDEAPQPKSRPSSPRRTSRATSWAGSLLKRRKSSAAESSAARGDKDLPDEEKLESSGSGSPQRTILPSHNGDKFNAEVATSYLVLPGDETNKILPRHAVIAVRKRFVRTDTTEDTREKQSKANNIQGSDVEYAVEVQAFDSNSPVLVNGNPVSGEAPTQLQHGDIIGFGSDYRFRVHVPSVAAAKYMKKETIKIEDVSLADLVAEANTICEKWHMHMGFSLVPQTAAVADMGNNEAASDVKPQKVLVRKGLGDRRFSVVQWPRAMLEEKVKFLRKLSESLESSISELPAIIEGEAPNDTHGAEGNAENEDIDAASLDISPVQDDDKDCDDPASSAVCEEEIIGEDDGNDEGVEGNDDKGDEDENEEGDEDIDAVNEMVDGVQSKLSLARDPDHASEREDSHNDKDSRSSLTRAIPASMSMDHFYTSTHETMGGVVTHSSPPPPLPCVRLLGHGRIYLSGLPLVKLPSQPSPDLQFSVAIYGANGNQIARLMCHLRVDEGNNAAAHPATSKDGDTASKQPGLKRTLSFPSHRASSTAGNQAASSKNVAVAAPTRRVGIQVTIETIEFVSKVPLAEQASLALKKWSASSSSSGHPESATESTPKFNISSKREESSDQNSVAIDHLIRQTALCYESGEYLVGDEYLAIEVWGYGEHIANSDSSEPLLSFPVPAGSKPHKLELFVSVDLEEREADGLFRPVAVKADGTLRLHDNHPRRVNLRITQADHKPFVLKEIQLVQLSAALSIRGAANLSVGDGKSSQWMVFPSATGAPGAAATMDLDASPTFKSWTRLFSRSPVEFDSSSRSLSVSLRWERGQDQENEVCDEEDSRSVFRIVVSLLTTLSTQPIVISKSIVTKISPTTVTSSQRLAREWENSRTAWWARESFSRSYRLGTWYAVELVSTGSHLDVGGHFDASNGDVDVTSKPDTDEPDSGDLSVSPIAEAAVSSHINGLRRLELAFAMERVRQEILVRYLATRISDEYPLTLDRAQEVFEQIVSLSAVEDPSTNEVTLPTPVIKVLQLDSALYLRHKANKELFVALESGDATGMATPSPFEEPNESSSEMPMMHFISEPTHLVTGEASGEMSGFLMFSTSVPLDESSAVVPLTASHSSSSSNVLSWARNTLSSHLGWDRRWFVLKRPFLYAYKSFARKEQVGVLDISKAQLVVPSTSSSRRLSTSSSKPAADEAPPASSTSLPFCFQLVSLAGSKCVVWSLQASTAGELRAWLVAIDPLKIEAREAVVSSNNAQTSSDAVAITA